MKKILITGANSYIGVSFENYLKQWDDQYSVDTVDMIDGSWREKDFSSYDTVFHVAGIAHADTGHVSEERKAFYYKINTDLAIETAKKAKQDGVKQFIFMSSAIVYGESAPIGKTKVITKDTKPSPANFYGDSKLQAENGILPLQDSNFNVVILRPPMIYGKGCKGNFTILEKLSNFLIFPKIQNERSMIYIGNFIEFVRLMIEHDETGIFLPCNKEYSNTSNLVQIIARAKNKKLLLVPGFSWLLNLCSIFSPHINKAFGNFTYSVEAGKYLEEYRKYTLTDSVNEMIKNKEEISR